MDGDASLRVSGDQTEEIKGGHTREVGSDVDLHIHGGYTEKVDAAGYTRTIDANGVASLHRAAVGPTCAEDIPAG